MTFEEWKRQVRDIVFDAITMDLDDLPDWDYRVAFDDGVTPVDAASFVLAEFAVIE